MGFAPGSAFAGRYPFLCPAPLEWQDSSLKQNPRRGKLDGEIELLSRGVFVNYPSRMFAIGNYHIFPYARYSELLFKIPYDFFLRVFRFNKIFYPPIVFSLVRRKMSGEYKLVIENVRWFKVECTIFGILKLHTIHFHKFSRCFPPSPTSIISNRPSKNRLHEPKWALQPHRYAIMWETWHDRYVMFWRFFWKITRIDIGRTCEISFIQLVDNPQAEWAISPLDSYLVIGG